MSTTRCHSRSGSAPANRIRAPSCGARLEPSKEKFTPGAVHVHDLHATILERLGIDHTRLSHLYQGRHFRLTDVQGHIVKNLVD